MSGREQVSIYIHVPFCIRKCDYCHFYVIPYKEKHVEEYLKALQLEWHRLLPLLQGKEIITLYFGGGTPSLLHPDAIKKIIDWVKPADNAEITLEVNPEQVTKTLMQSFLRAGVNRISLGVQSFDTSHLIQLSRAHTSEKAENAIITTCDAGFTNISIDLMYDLPNQTVKKWHDTLERVESLPITHLSLYNLTIEPHTLFHKREKELKPYLPSEEASKTMLLDAIATLTSIGFTHYEISAFCRDSFASKHNSGYWTGRPFLGFGPSAFSFWEGKRTRNIAHLGRYCRALEEGHLPTDFEEKLEREAASRELTLLRMRLFEWVDSAPFEKNGLKEMCEQGLILERENKIRLSEKGILFYDTLASELI